MLEHPACRHAHKKRTVLLSLQAASLNHRILPGHEARRCLKESLQVISHCNGCSWCFCSRESSWHQQIAVTQHLPSPFTSPSTKLGGRTVPGYYWGGWICVSQNVVQSHTRVHHVHGLIRVELYAETQDPPPSSQDAKCIFYDKSRSGVPVVVDFSAIIKFGTWKINICV